ncbi:MAG: ABC transporter permease [Bacteroidetes bacterium]|nr:ABC transporter permease [Bacteroidota bacterium]MCW5895643.1 ABC transporter permease [Bacteroidota bacterium]
MSLSYTVKESLSGFTRTKLSTAISIITIGISLVLLGVFAVISINTSRFIEMLRAKVELEAFLQEPVTRDQINTLINRVLAVKGVDSLIYISKDEAAKIFKEEFGEDIKKVLDFNPLPPSFKIYIKPDFRTTAAVDGIYRELVALRGIDQIIYRKELLELIDKRTTTINNVTLGLGLLISISAILLVSNTIRLAIYAKRKLIRTMELVGATWTFIRLPFLIEGMVQGVVGGMIAAGVLYIVLEYAARLVASDFSAYIHMPSVFYAVVIATGLALGLLGAVISIVRFMRVAT